MEQIVATNQYQSSFGMLGSSWAGATCGAEAFQPVTATIGDDQQQPVSTKTWRGEAPLGMNVGTLAPYYPMSATHAAVCQHVDVIRANLETCFRSMSLFCRYSDSGMWLQAPEQLEIHLNLWRRRNDEETIFVELTRLSGDAVVFHQYARCILSAAGGNFSQTRHFLQGKTSAPGTLQRPAMSSVGMAQAKEAIEIAAHMLADPRSKLTGMEMLSILTDMNKSSLQTCQATSRMVLFGECHTCTTAKLPLVHDLIQAALSESDNGYPMNCVDYDSDEDDILGGTENREASTMKHYALTVFANALEVMQQDPALSAWTEFVSRSAGRNIFSHLVDEEMAEAMNRPHDASLAIRSLSVVAACNDTLRRQLSQPWVLEDISSALDMGRKCHANLEFECTRLLATLGVYTPTQA